MKARPRQFCGVPGCGKSFDRPAKLVDHQRFHTGERPFKCTICGSSFAQKKHLQVHELHHLEPQLRPFQCQLCGKGYVSRQQYNRHKQTHEPPKQHRCTLCGLEFIQKKSYESHVARHRSCTLCEKVCKSDRDLALHHLTKHTERFHCSFCSEKFVTAQELKSHCSSKHANLIGKNDFVPEATAFLVGLEYEQRRLSCPFECGKRFKRQYDVQRHLSKEHPSAEHPQN